MTGRCPKCGCVNELTKSEIKILESGEADCVVLNCIACGTSLVFEQDKRNKPKPDR